MRTWLGFIWPVSKKARFFLALLALLVIGWVLFSNKSRPAEQAQKSNSRALLAREEQIKKLSQDTDRDGLKDWEEAIYHTDPNNPDTDGDDTKDGDEIAMSRDPLKAGKKLADGTWSDKVVAPTDEIANSPYLLPNNLTGLLAEKFGINVIVPKLSGSQRQIDLESVGNQIADETVPDSTGLDFYFQEKDIIMSRDDSPAAIRTYDKETDEILIAAFRGLQKNPLIIFSEALQADDLSKVATLDSYLRAYDVTLEKTKNLSVPPSVTSTHLRYLNALAALREAVRKMRTAETDVLKAVVGAREFSNAASTLTLLAKDFQKKLYDSSSAQ